LTYTPSLDRILPPPAYLHVKIRNTSATPLRAAYLHGPYTLYVACYPSTFDPNKKHENWKEEGCPEYEPQLKAGSFWTAKLTVPEDIRKDVNKTDSSHTNEEGERKSFTWIVEIASQILFSPTAAVHYEVLVGRDEKSVDLGFHGVIGSGLGAPGKLEDHHRGGGSNATQPKGVFSKAVRLTVDDTESLWNTPPFPEWEHDGAGHVEGGKSFQHGDKRDSHGRKHHKSRKQKKIHLVLLTHGIHSNVGADMLYLKESIDAAARQAREDAKRRKQQLRAQRMTELNQLGRDSGDRRTRSAPDLMIATAREDDPADAAEDDDDDEQVVVRGFNGNVVKTERGIQYLGKRLAKYVLTMTYPDQPFLPVESSISKSIKRSLTGQKPSENDDKKPSHKNSSIVRDGKHKEHHLAYKFTSISFISHSLGGLIQTYAIAYIQKHSPEFFDLIKPINFVAMATPFLGLSNENPIYVKFALDFGLVGRTGQDLGLTWRAPTLAKSGWGAVISGLKSDPQKGERQPDPRAKPLLRILPTGPAHVALKKFRNRTVYSNVVNDGIVPLRTSCLLFLDWRGLGRVENARRENGLVGTMVGWGWAEMTGQNASSPRKPFMWGDIFGDSGDDVNNTGKNSPDPESSVPLAETSEAFDYEERAEPDERQFLGQRRAKNGQEAGIETSGSQSPNLWNEFLSFFMPQAGQKAPQEQKPPPAPAKKQKIYRRGQTMATQGNDSDDRSESQGSSEDSLRPGLVRGSSLYSDQCEDSGLEAPPKTTFFESAGDLLRPPLPPREFLLDPAARPRTIFHDRVYHPQDIPPPPAKRQRTFAMKRSSREGQASNLNPNDPLNMPLPPPVEAGTMKIEEKIARAYHKDLSWRKVLVRLEPDAHNNMVVRRMFANAYGWPVIKHICDTHFGYTAAAKTRDDEEATNERAKPEAGPVGPEGEQVAGQVSLPEERLKRPSDEQDRGRRADAVQEDAQRLPSEGRAPEMVKRTASEIRESTDELSDLVSKVSAWGEGSTSYSSLNSGKAALSRLARQDSARWSDRFFDGSEDDSEDESFLEELQKATQRGEDLSEPSSTDTSTASLASTRLSGKRGEANHTPPLALMLPEEGRTLVAEPAELEPSGPHTPESEPTSDRRSLNLAGVGLGKTVEENLVSEREGDGAGIAEQVAFARSKKASQ